MKIKIPQEEIDKKYIRVNKHPDLDLYIYNYTQSAQFERHWNEWTMMCRGLVLDGEGNIETQEGCLSVPGFYESVFRHETILVEALDQDGQVFQLKADGLLAICIQHEMDHLNGKLFVDYLSPAKRQLLRKKLLKQQKLQRP